MLSVNSCMIIIPQASIFPRPSSKLSYVYGLCPFPDIYGRKLCCTCASVTRRTLYMRLLLKLTFLMILRRIAILLMSPLNIIQQIYIYWNDLTVCIVSLYNLLLCILLLLVYIHCYDFAPCGTLIEIKISFFLPYTLNIYLFPRYSPHFLFQINITMIINMIYDYYHSGPALRGPATNAVLCKTYSVLCVLEQPILDNSSVGPLSAEPNREQLIQLS